MIPILLAAIVWGKKFFRKKVMIHCDNEGATKAWENLGSSSTGVLDLMRRILAVAARNNFTITLKHIAGPDYSIAEALSRVQEHRSRRLAPTASKDPVAFPDVFCELRDTYI